MNLGQLKKLLATPTAPFCEKQVKNFFADFFLINRVPFFEDSYGNIVVGAKSDAEYRRKVMARGQALKVVVAHMDHPGFHGNSWIGKQAKNHSRMSINWFGGSPTKSLNGSRMWLSSDRTPGKFFEGTLQKAKMNKRGSALASGEVVIATRDRASLAEIKPSEIFGGFGFQAPVWQKGKILYTKAADDLIGAFSIATVAADLYRRKNSDRANFIGLLTRAEEVGFVGMLEHLRRSQLTKTKREVVVLSLEASRTLEKARVGLGPVVRLGDAGTVFDSRWTQTLAMTALKTLKKKYQKRIMDGGSCEATAATVHGIKATGISVPLGNYHNMNFEGGPGSSKAARGPAPEFVHIDDVRGQITLARAFIGTRDTSKAFTPFEKRFKKLLRDYRKYA